MKRKIMVMTLAVAMGASVFGGSAQAAAEEKNEMAVRTIQDSCPNGHSWGM